MFSILVGDCIATESTDVRTLDTVRTGISAASSRSTITTTGSTGIQCIAATAAADPRSASTDVHIADERLPLVTSLTVGANRKKVRYVTLTGKSGTLSSTIPGARRVDV